MKYTRLDRDRERERERCRRQKTVMTAQTRAAGSPSLVHQPAHLHTALETQGDLQPIRAACSHHHGNNIQLIVIPLQHSYSQHHGNTHTVQYLQHSQSVVLTVSVAVVLTVWVLGVLNCMLFPWH